MVAAEAPALLEATGLVRRYGSREVLNVERVAVSAGEVLAVVGSNGAGKSTLFRLLLLLEQPDAGTVRVAGKVMQPGDPVARGRLAGVFQKPVLFTGSVRENVGFGLRAAGIAGPARADRVAAALSWLGLESYADAPVHTLSGGEAQRVALARALVVEPDVLLLDEPTSSLDVSIRRRFRDDLERVARQHARAIVLITHDAAEAFALADRIAVLHRGRIVQTGTPADVVLSPGTPFVAELTGAELLLHGTAEAVEDGLAVIRLGGTALWAVTRPDTALAAGDAAVVSYRPEDVTLSLGADVAETSAMNRIEATLDAVFPAGALVRVRLRCVDGTVLTSLLTRRSLDALGLGSGSPVTAHLKATALHAWKREPQHT